MLLPRSLSTPTPPASFLARHGLTLLAGFLLASLALFAGFSAFSYEIWLWTVLLLAVAAGLAVVAAVFLRPLERPGRTWLVLALALGLGARLAPTSTRNMTSTDALRYVWDGKVLAHGINPYAHAPDSHALDHLRTDPIDHLVNAPQVRTPYPPLAEAVFLGAYALTPGRLLGYQLLNLLAEISAWFLLLGLLGRLGLPRSRILLLAWAPLLVVEGYLPGHTEVLALPLLCLLVAAMLERRPVAAGLSLAAACLIKPLALVFLPAVARELGWRRTGVLLAVLAATLAAAYAPFLLWGGHSHWGPMALMAEKWSFNGTVAPLLGVVLPDYAARIAAFGGMLALVVAGAFLGRDFVSRCLLALTAVVVMSPVLFSWYVIWIVPFVVLRPDPAALALALLVPLTDIVAVNVYLHHTFDPPLWSTLAVFVPFYALLAAGWARKWGMFARPLASDHGMEDSTTASFGGERERRS
ncbi:MAG: hypothetical protein HY905_11945 [Deltaproteobacteria bacterium]|nr:hypothetical protein [Deltaproteobacteria bacterium]